jgi:hypothetical protein
MPDRLTVSFALQTVPEFNRHRISVWSPDGAELSPPSAQGPVDVTVGEGATFFVEASVPALPGRKGSTRQHVRWELRAARDASALLCLGSTPTYGPSGTIEIRVEGAEQQGKPKNVD